MIPGVRSLISLPAGASAMRVWPFLGLTAAGSAVWNGLLIGGGIALGSNWERVEQYAAVLDWVLISGLVLVVLVGIMRRVRRRAAARREEPVSSHESGSNQ